MNRRAFLASMSSLAALGAAPVPVTGRVAMIKTSSNSPGRSDGNLPQTSSRRFARAWNHGGRRHSWRGTAGLRLRLRQTRNSKLRNGEALRQAYGDRVGFHYYEDEDCGIFWSNDPGITIGEMVRAIGVLELEDEMARVREFYKKARIRK